MSRSESVGISEIQPIFGGSRCSKLFTFTTTIIMISVVLTFVLSIIIFVKVKSDYEVATTTPLPPYNPSLVTSIRIDDVMRHLQELQNLATASGGTRAVNTQGFNDTLDYIVNYLSIYTNFITKRSYFYLKDFALAKNPILVSSIDGVIRNYTYSTDLSFTDFTFVRYSASQNNSDFIGLTVIPNLGCNDSDWQNALPSVAGRAAIVKRGDCPFVEKGRLAEKYNATALLLYNDGTSPDRFAPISVSLSQNNTVPVLFVSYIVAESLIDAAQNESNNVQVQLNIELKDLPDFPVGNICADTPTGNVTQTIVIGSHSDSVPAGPGINDNGKIITKVILLN
jgi:aminopeptidase Y